MSLRSRSPLNMSSDCDVSVEHNFQNMKKRAGNHHVGEQDSFDSGDLSNQQGSNKKELFDLMQKISTNKSWYSNEELSDQQQSCDSSEEEIEHNHKVYVKNCLQCMNDKNEKNIGQMIEHQQILSNKISTFNEEIESIDQRIDKDQSEINQTEKQRNNEIGGLKTQCSILEEKKRIDDKSIKKLEEKQQNQVERKEQLLKDLEESDKQVSMISTDNTIKQQHYQKQCDEFNFLFQKQRDLESELDTLESMVLTQDILDYQEGQKRMLKEDNFSDEFEYTNRNCFLNEKRTKSFSMGGFCHKIFLTLNTCLGFNHDEIV